MIGRTYELRKTIGSGGCGTVFNGRIQSTSKFIMSRNAKKRVFTFDNNFLNELISKMVTGQRKKLLPVGLN